MAEKRYFVKSEEEIRAYSKGFERHCRVDNNTFVEEMFQYCGVEITEKEYTYIKKYPNGGKLDKLGGVYSFTPEMIKVIEIIPTKKIGRYVIKRK